MAVMVVESGRKGNRIICRLTNQEKIKRLQFEQLNSGSLGQQFLIIEAIEKRTSTVLYANFKPGLTVLIDLLQQGTGRNFLFQLFFAIIRALRLCEEKMLRISNLALDPKLILVDQKSNHFSFAYWPIEGCPSILSLPDVFQNLIFVSIFTSQEDLPYVRECLQFLTQTGGFSLLKFEKFLNALQIKSFTNRQTAAVETEGSEPSPSIFKEQANGIKPRPTEDFGTTVLNNERNEFGTTILESAYISEPPWLIRKSSGEKILLEQIENTLGSDSLLCNLPISGNTSISRKHACIFQKEAAFHLKDLGSTNRTYLNGQLLQAMQEYTLNSGALIRLANEDFIFYESDLGYKKRGYE